MIIPTGLEEVDNILDGGLKSGIIDIFGAPGTGKTQLALQITKNCISLDGKVLFQDTSGKFRPERLHDLLINNHFDPILLENIDVVRITNFFEQENIRKLTNLDKYDLVVIDNISDLFSFEYQRNNQDKKNIIFMKYIRDLSKLSLEKKIPILILNTVRNKNLTEQESLSDSLNLFTHIKIHLSKKNPREKCDTIIPDKNTYYECKIMLPRRMHIFRYKILKEGLVQDTK